MLVPINDSAGSLSGDLKRLLNYRRPTPLDDATGNRKDLPVSFIKYSCLYSSFMAELFHRLRYPFFGGEERVCLC